MDRYFVDQRVGCIAVRDRFNTNPDYQGLHRDTKGVVRYWGGAYNPNKYWAVSRIDIKAAHALCDSLNEREFYSIGGCD